MTTPAPGAVGASCLRTSTLHATVFATSASQIIPLVPDTKPGSADQTWTSPSKCPLLTTRLKHAGDPCRVSWSEPRLVFFLASISNSLTNPPPRLDLSLAAVLIELAPSSGIPPPPPRSIPHHRTITSASRTTQSGGQPSRNDWTQVFRLVNVACIWTPHGLNARIPAKVLLQASAFWHPRS